VVAGHYAYLDIQISLWKMHPPSQDPGAWADILVSANKGRIGMCCEWLAYNPLEQKQGFFIHLMRTYLCITPSFLEGFSFDLGWVARQRM
jgi:hypothetical protein